MWVNGYYHWKVAELGQMDRCEHLRGKRPPRGPIIHPSIKLWRDTRLAKEKAKEAKEAPEAQRPDGDEATMNASRGESAPVPMDVDRPPQAEAGVEAAIAGMTDHSRRRSWRRTTKG